MMWISTIGGGLIPASCSNRSILLEMSLRRARPICPVATKNINYEPSCIGKRSIKGLPRHHLTRTIAQQPVSFIDPQLELGRSYMVPSLKDGKPTANIASH